MVRANDVGWTSTEILGTLGAGALLLAAFFAWERRVAAPLVPLGMLRVRAFAAGSATAFLMSGAIFGGAFMVTEHFQFTLGYSPVATGVRLLPFTMTPIFIAPIAGAVSDRIGRRPLIVAGLALQAAGFAWVALIGSPHASLFELLLALFIAGAGTSMALPTVPTAVLSSVAPSEMGKASGINNMMQHFGGVFAVAIGSAVLTSYAHVGSAANVAVSDGFRPAIVVSAVLALLGALSAIALTKRGETSAAIEPSCRTDRSLNEANQQPSAARQRLVADGWSTTRRRILMSGERFGSFAVRLQYCREPLVPRAVASFKFVAQCL